MLREALVQNCSDLSHIFAESRINLVLFRNRTVKTLHPFQTLQYQSRTAMPNAKIPFFFCFFFKLYRDQMYKLQPDSVTVLLRHSN